MFSFMNLQGTLEHDHYVLSWQLGNKTLCSSPKLDEIHNPFGFRATSKIVRHPKFMLNLITNFESVQKVIK
jgi:hypothetical protein